MSIRQACRTVSLNRTVYFYQPDTRRDERVILALTELAELYPRYGFKKLFQILRRQGNAWESHAVILIRSQSVISEVTVMKTFVGLDVSQKKTSVCVIDHNGNKIRMANVDTHTGVVADYLFSEGFDKLKVGLETGPLCVWLYHSLKSFGLDIDCIPARLVHAALSM